MKKNRFLICLILTATLLLSTFNNAFATDPVTWNPYDKGTGVTLSNENLTLSYTTYEDSNVRATVGKNTGKWYWEISCDSTNLSGAVNLGVAYKSVPISSYIYSGFVNKSALYRDYGNTTGIYGLALDIEGRTLMISKDGVFITTIVLPEVLIEDLYPIIGDDDGGATATYTANFGASSFAYSIPTDYSSYDSSITQVPSTEVPDNITAIAGNSKVDLSWTTVAESLNYNVKRATTTSGPYTTIASITGTNYSDISVTSGNTYYYVVTAVSSAGESANSSEVSATPTATPVSSSVIEGTRAILVITMTSGVEKEYDLSAIEIESFLNWYNDKENNVAGTKSYYSIKKTYNIKPFLNRWDYIVFSKIQEFEINDYNE